MCHTSTPLATPCPLSSSLSPADVIEVLGASSVEVYESSSPGIFVLLHDGTGSVSWSFDGNSATASFVISCCPYQVSSATRGMYPPGEYP